jgi:hypothetical protein
MTDKQAAIVDAKEKGREFARVYHAVHGRIPRPNAPYSKAESHWKTNQIVESAAGSDYRDYYAIGFDKYEVNPIYLAYVKAFRSACYNWKPTDAA